MAAFACLSATRALSSPRSICLVYSTAFIGLMGPANIANHNHGLGLAIVAAIARMHGGATFVRSAAGTTSVGLTMTVMDSCS